MAGEMLDAILGGGSLLMNMWGGLEQNAMAREDRDYWRRMTADALGRIDALGAEGQIKLQNLTDTLRPGYDRLAGDWSQGARGIADTGIKDWSNLYGTTTGNYQSGTTGIQGLSGDRMNALKGELSSLQTGMDTAYGNRLAKGMSMLEGYGNQAKADVRQDFGDRTKSELARLGTIGLGNTSAGAVTQRGMAREQSNSMNRLNEDLAKIGLDTYSGLSGDQLASRSNLGQFGIGMTDTARAQDLSQRERMLGNAADLSARLGSDTLNAQQGLRQFDLENQVAASQAQLGEHERLALQPFNWDTQMMDKYISTAMDWGLPPEVVPWQLSVGQSMGNMFNARRAGGGGGGGSSTGSQIGASAGSAAAGSAATIGTLALLSDRRLKRDIRDSRDGLEAVSELRPASFTWNSDSREDIGLIAQEVREVLPQAVLEQPDGTLMINYASVVAVLINAVKDLSGRIRELETTAATA